MEGYTVDCMKYKQLARREADHVRRMLRSGGVETMATMFRWFLNPAHKPHFGSKLQAYRRARIYATGGRIPITISRLPL